MTDIDNDLRESALVLWSPNLSRCIVASMVGVFIGGGLIYFMSPVFAQKLYEPLGLSPTDEQLSKYRSSIIQFWTQNHAFDFANIGGALGVSIGLFTTAKKRAMSAMIAGSLGLLLGGITGFSASRWAVHEFVMNSDQSLIRSILLNSIVWSVVPSAIWVAIGSIQGIRPLSILGVGGLNR